MVRDLSQLLKDLCPNGVAYKAIGAVCETITDYTAAGSFADIAKNVKYISDGLGFAQLIRTTDLKSGFANPDKFIYVNEHAFNYLWRVKLNSEGLVLPNVGNCGEVYYVTPEKLPYPNNVLGPNAIWVKSNSALNKYLYYVFQGNEFQQKLAKIVSPTGQTKFNKTNFKDLTIPIPPKEIQAEIVMQLDYFEDYIVALEEEHGLRRKQYEFCASELFERAMEQGAVQPIRDICSIEKGKTPIQKAIPGKYPMVVTTSERKTSDSFQFDTKAVCIPLVSSRGHGVASLNHVYYQEGKFALGNILCALVPKDTRILDAKYLYYYFEHTKDYILVPLMKGGANVSLRTDDIAKVKIPVPSMTIQKDIVEKLTVFDEFCNNSEGGIEEEINLRKIQYQYYRDRILAFKEASK